MHRILLVLMTALILGLTGQEVRVDARRVTSIHGVALTEGGGGPIAGATIRLEGGGIETLEVICDAHGFFEFSKLPAHDDTLEVVATERAGVRWVRSRLKPRAGGGELRFVARNKPTEFFRGQVIRRDNGDPVAGAQVKLVELRGGFSEVCTTDQNGLLETRARFLPGRLELLPWDNQELKGSGAHIRARFEWQATDAQAPLVIQLPVGPRLELDVALPVGAQLADYHVEIRKPEEALAGKCLDRVAVHAGERPWIRVPGSALYLADKVLYLVRTEGAEVWRAQVSKETAGSVRLEPMSCGTIAGALIESSSFFGPGSSPTHRRRGVQLSFERLGLSEEEPSSFNYRCRSIDSPFEMERVPAGYWRVRVGSAFYEEVVSEVFVPAGSEARLELTLGEPRRTGTLRVRIVDQAGDFPAREGRADSPGYSAWVVREGRYLAYTIQTSAPCGHGVSTWFRRVQRDGRWVLEAELEDVPEGEYRISPFSSSRLIEPALQTVAHDGLAVFELPVPTSQRVFGIRSPFPDSVLPFFAEVVSVARDSDFPLRSFTSFNGVLAYEVPPEANLDWCLIPWDHRRVYGTREDFVQGEDGSWAEVQLTPGYSIRAYAKLEGGEPAAGVTVGFAGEEFITDADGFALLACDEPRPVRRLEVAGHAIVSGDVEAAGGFQRSLPDLHFVLRTE